MSLVETGRVTTWCTARESVRGLVRPLDGETVPLGARAGRLGLDRLVEAVTTPGADVVVVTGSSSVGRADHLHAVPAEVDAVLHADGMAVLEPGRNPDDPAEILLF